MKDQIATKGPGDPETWGPCIDAPMGPRTEEEVIKCAICGFEFEEWETPFELQEYLCYKCFVEYEVD